MSADNTDMPIMWEMDPEVENVLKEVEQRKAEERNRVNDFDIIGAVAEMLSHVCCGLYQIGMKKSERDAEVVLHLLIERLGELDSGNKSE